MLSKIEEFESEAMTPTEGILRDSEGWAVGHLEVIHETLAETIEKMRQVQSTDPYGNDGDF